MADHCSVASTGVSCVSLVLLTEGFLFVLGGQDENKQTLSSGEKYDPDANTWTALPPMNEVRCDSRLGCVSFLSGTFIGCGFLCRERRGSLALPYLESCSPESPSASCLLLASCLAPPPCRDLFLTSLTARSGLKMPSQHLPLSLLCPTSAHTGFTRSYETPEARSFLCSVWAVGK